MCNSALIAWGLQEELEYTGLVKVHWEESGGGTPDSPSAAVEKSSVLGRLPGGATALAVPHAPVSNPLPVLCKQA